ncbi:MAG: cytochrome c oxidase accessory protein FixG [Candidatus Azotimanducaceae bacterium]|jgi:cytochrome c oxidase accessory protein FixG
MCEVWRLMMNAEFDGVGSNRIAAVEEIDSTVLNLYEKREKIYTRKIEGFYQLLRAFTGWPLLVAYFATPWLIVNDHQAVLFDLPARQFHIFWMTFWPQDFSLLAWALVISAFVLFFVTNLAGRVWCGYTCPQTVWTAMFMWAEQVTEGNRNERIKMDAASLSLSKFSRRAAKHFLWVGIALATGVTFIGYFYDLKSLIVDAFNWQLPLVATFWTLFFTVATYLNAGWMREQVCKYMCPYARFQSAMFDKDTLVVSYDKARGEQRGSRKKGLDPESIDMGDCIDCTWCVQVCPTGIDIRDGLQYECINCAACVDACDSIMDKMGYAHGLIAYTTEHQLEGKPWTWKRPRLIGYGLAMVVMISLFTGALLTRKALDVDVLRSRGQLFQEIPGGYIQNTYTVKAMNKTLKRQQYVLSVTGLPDLKWIPKAPFDIEGGEVQDISLTVIVDPDQLQAMNNELTVTLTEHLSQPLDKPLDKPGSQASVDKETRFIGPSILKDRQ